MRWAVVLVLFFVGCIGSPEPKNPMTKKAVKEDPPCSRCVTTKRAEPTTVKPSFSNPYLTDEEQELLDRIDKELDGLHGADELLEREKLKKVEKGDKRKVY